MRKFSIGVFLDIFTDNRSQWEDDLAFVSRLPEVEHLELLLEYIPHTDRELAFFLRLRDRHKLIVHATSLDLTLLSPHVEIRKASFQKLRQAYECSRRIGANIFTIHAGLMPKFWTERKALKILKQQLQELQTYEALPVCVENMSENWSIQIPYPSTAAHIKNVAAIAPITFDTGHFLKSGSDPLATIKQLLGKIANIHLHDGQKGKAHLPLGFGSLDLSGLVKILTRGTYNKFVTLEVVGKKEIESSWQTLRKALF